MNDKLTEAYKLEQKAEQLRNEARQEQRQKEVREERAFMDSGLRISVASDYASLTVDDLGFYFGYEEEVDGEWAFIASDNGKEVLRLAKSKVHPRKGETPEYYLLAGVGHYLRFK
jgi:hypothetical protein